MFSLRAASAGEQVRVIAVPREEQFGYLFAGTSFHWHVADLVRNIEGQLKVGSLLWLSVIILDPFA